jgi:hypothetical protein
MLRRHGKKIASSRSLRGRVIGHVDRAPSCTVQSGAMLTSTADLAASFDRARRGGAACADAALDAVLLDFWERGRAEWPDLTLDATTFAA